MFSVPNSVAATAATWLGLAYNQTHPKKLVDLEIDKFSTIASLLIDTSSTAERIISSNPTINFKKYEHPCQVEDYWIDSTTKK